MSHWKRPIIIEEEREQIAYLHFLDRFRLKDSEEAKDIWKSLTRSIRNEHTISTKQAVERYRRKFGS